MSIMRKKNVFYLDHHHFNINMELMTLDQQSILLQLL
jgi:hypothetical protein